MMMHETTATALAQPNIAFIKYRWQNAVELTASVILVANLSLADIFY